MQHRLFLPPILVYSLINTSSWDSFDQSKIHIDSETSAVTIFEKSGANERQAIAQQRLQLLLLLFLDAQVAGH